MDLLNDIYKTLTAEGFSGEALALIDKYVNNIQNGYANFPRYTMPEHAGFCMAGAALVGASIVADYARTSLTTGSHAADGKRNSPSNWKIDKQQWYLITAGGSSLTESSKQRSLKEHSSEAKTISNSLILDKEVISHLK